MISILSRTTLAQRYARWRVRKEEILKRLSASEVSGLNGHTRRITGHSGEQVRVAQNRVVIVDDGLVCLDQPSGARILGPGEIFGTLFLPAPETTLHCLCESRLIIMEAAVFRDVLGHYPVFLLRMIELQEIRQRSLEAQIRQLNHQTAVARTAMALLELSETYGDGSGGTEDALALGQEDLARLLNLSPQILSRVIEQMTSAGVMVWGDRAPFIRDRAGLVAMAQEERV